MVRTTTKKGDTKGPSGRPRIKTFPTLKRTGTPEWTEEGNRGSDETEVPRSYKKGSHPRLNM